MGVGGCINPWSMTLAIAFEMVSRDARNGVKGDRVILVPQYYVDGFCICNFFNFIRKMSLDNSRCGTIVIVAL